MTDALARLTTALADRYRIEGELGQGGMATVYLAEDLKHKRRVAIKVLKPELAAVLGAERFVQEITTTAALQHPHILPLFDSGTADGFLFYVMPFIDGETLRTKLDRETQLGVDEAVRIASDVASALHYAHTHGVIHRDIKPENILLHDGRPMVADFGIALAVSAAAGGRMTETGLSLGTPHYMSPEQATAEKEITGRSDVYSLGSVLYEMLAGDPPHTGSSAQQIIMKIITEQPAVVTQLRKAVPSNVAEAVAKSLEKLPADRFDSAKAFAEALANPAFTAGASATGAAGGQGHASRAVSTRLFAATAAVAVVALALAGWGWLRAPAGEGVTRFNVELATAQFENILVGQYLVEHLFAIAPDGSSIVFIDSTADGVELRRKRRGENTSEPMAGTSGGHAPIFSPDGEWIAFFMEGGRLRKVPVGGGGTITLATDGNRSYFSAAWLDDGTIVYANAMGGLSRVPADGGSSEVVATAESMRNQDVSSLWPLPRGRGVLVTNCPGNCVSNPSIAAYDFAADSLITLVTDAIGAWYAPGGKLLYTLAAGGLYAVDFDLKTLRITSGPVSVIPDVSPSEFTLSASGTVLYRVGETSARATDLLWVSRDGTARPFDTSWQADFFYPSISPDGRSVAVSVADESTQLWVRRADGSRQKLSLTGSFNWRPSWSADGRRIGYTSYSADNKTRDIYEVSADGSSPPRLVLDAEADIWEVELSRDGRWMVWRTDMLSRTGSELFARRLEGDTSVVPIAVGAGNRRQAALSPDASRIAFVSDESGRLEVYIASFPDMTGRRLVSQGGASEPRWAANGRELFFKSRGSLMVVDVPPGSAIAPSVPRVLFSVTGYRGAQNRQQYDVSPDGSRFLMIKQNLANAAPKLVYAERWFEELKGSARR